MSRRTSVQLSTPYHFQPFKVAIADELAYVVPSPGGTLAATNVLVIEDSEGNVGLIPYGHIRSLRPWVEGQRLRCVQEPSKGLQWTSYETSRQELKAEI